MTKQCQSCGMPLKKDSDRGTEKNNQLSDKYCTLCYKDGSFINPNMTVDQMQELVTKVLREEKRWPKILVKLVVKQIPKLERWQ